MEAKDSAKTDALDDEDKKAGLGLSSTRSTLEERRKVVGSPLGHSEQRPVSVCPAASRLCSHILQAFLFVDPF